MAHTGNTNVTITVAKDCNVGPRRTNLLKWYEHNSPHPVRIEVKRSIGTQVEDRWVIQMHFSYLKFTFSIYRCQSLEAATNTFFFF